MRFEETKISLPNKTSGLATWPGEVIFKSLKALGAVVPGQSTFFAWPGGHAPPRLEERRSKPPAWKAHITEEVAQGSGILESSQSEIHHSWSVGWTLSFHPT